MVNKLLFAFIFSILLSGCDETVPEVNDPKHIVINGELLTQSQFLNAYCQKQKNNPTCDKVLKAKIDKVSNGDMPKW